MTSTATPPAVINFGSLNIDHVYAVPHIVRPGETLASSGYAIHCGGKGLNQSIALARAGVVVRHAGRIGRDGLFLKEKLAAEGVLTDAVAIGDTPTGQALIQVAEGGQNAIVLFPGANLVIADDQLDAAFATARPGDFLLLQNETNITPAAIHQGHARGLTICLNPAPFDDRIQHLPLAKLGLLVVNETEGLGLSGRAAGAEIARCLARRYPQTTVVVTCGKAGALVAAGDSLHACPALPVTPVDTTAAGDTFIGYFLAGLIRQLALPDALRLACAAASLSTTRPGAADSIPTWQEVEQALATVRGALSVESWA